MADQEHTVEIQHNLDEYIAKLKEANELWEKHNDLVKDAGMKLYSLKMPGSAPIGTPANSNVPGGSSTFASLQTLFMRNSLKDFKDFRKYMKEFQLFSGNVAQISSSIISIGSGLLRFGAGGLVGGAAGVVGGVRNALSSGDIPLLAARPMSEA